MINNRKYVLSTGTSDAAKWLSCLSSWEEYIESHVHFIVQNSEFTRKLGKLVVEMAEVQNHMSWLVPLMLCDLQVIQPCSTTSTSSHVSTCYWVMEAQCAPGLASWGAGTYCWMSPYGLNFCWFSRILFLEVSKTPVNLRFRDLVFNMHLYELTKYSQESSPWMVKRDILCAIWSPNVCSLRCCGYSRAWTAWVIYILMYTPLSWADEVRVSSWDLITAVICYEGADSSYTFMSNSD